MHVDDMCSASNQHILRVSINHCYFQYFGSKFNAKQYRIAGNFRGVLFSLFSRIYIDPRSESEGVVSNFAHS